MAPASNPASTLNWPLNRVAELYAAQLSTLNQPSLPLLLLVKSRFLR